MRRFDARLLVAIGLCLFAASCFLNIDINQDYSGPQLLVPNLVRAVGQALVLTPLSVLATAGIERENAASASAMFNMMRNLGGSIGIAAAANVADQARAVPFGDDHAHGVAVRRGDARAAGRAAALFHGEAAPPILRRRGMTRSWRWGGGAGAGIFPRLQRHVLPHGVCAAVGCGCGSADGTQRGRRWWSRRTLTAHELGQVSSVGWVECSETHHFGVFPARRKMCWPRVSRRISSSWAWLARRGTPPVGAT